MWAAAAYAGIEPFSTYGEMARVEMARLNAEYGPSQLVAYPHITRFSGTYTTTIPLLNSEQVLTFKRDTLTIVDEFTGTHSYHYLATMQSESEGILELTEIASGDPSEIPIQYVEEADCLVLYSMGREKPGVTYCK